MKNVDTLLIRGIISICLFFLLKVVISYVALSSFSVLTIDAEFDHDDIIAAYYSSGINNVGFREKQSKRSDQFNGGKRSAENIALNNHVTRKLRIDIGGRPGQVKIFSFRLKSRFGRDITFNHRQIHEQFTANSAINSYTLETDHVLAEIISADPFITLKKDLVLQNTFLSFFLPLILAGLFFIFSPKMSVRDLDAIKDITSKKSSAGINFDSLDGVRGLAALMILGVHTGMLDKGGVFGVWLFFCLSGFLLATPFINNPDKALSYSYMSTYLLRRGKRIIPMYFTMITCFTLFSGHVDVAIRHYLFLQADGHYWTVTQEMFFYLLLPVVMIANTLLYRLRPFLSIVLFLILIIVSNMFLDGNIIRLYGNGASLKPLVGIFFSGILFAILHNQITASTRLSGVFGTPAARRIMALTGLALIAVVLVLFSPAFNRQLPFDASTHPGWFGFLAALFIFLTIMSKGSLLERSMNALPLRAMGIVGFSFYLLHPQVISTIRAISMYFTSYYPTGIVLFLASGTITYLLSLFTYSYIERPFIALAKKDRT
ncbi:MAG: acyltransferase [Desulfocapsaceae bacterium]|jgi:peptidoglycan/LPS O-acetylase OafA/YrhL|nr:acyltransferase [Desulfocapsaceae bacterium]